MSLSNFSTLPWATQSKESQLIEYSKEYNGDQGYFLKIYFISDKENRNFWKVVESSIIPGLKTGLEKRFFDKTAPIILREDWEQAPKLGHPSPYVEDMVSEQEPDRKGDFIAVGTTNEGRTGWVIVKITDKQTEIDHRDGKIRFVSPSIESIKENAQGEDLVWRINHLAFVTDPAYGFEAQVTGSCTGPQGECILHLSKQASVKKLKKLQNIPLKKLSQIPLIKLRNIPLKKQSNIFLKSSVSSCCNKIK